MNTENKNILLNKLFYSSIFSFAFGIVISNIYIINYIFLYLFLFFNIFIFIFLKINNKIFKNLWILFLFLSFFSFGFLLHQNYFQNKKGYFDNYLGKKIETNVIIDDEVLEKDFYFKATARIENFNDRIVLKLPKYPIYKYGDKLKVTGFLSKVKNFKNDTGRYFDYINFLKKDGIYYEIKKPVIKYISSNNGSVIKQKLFLLKKTLLNQAKLLIPNPESSLLGGLLLGAKENMSKETLNDFRRTGVIHIVVLSGYNLTIVAEFIMILLSFLGFTISAWIGSISIVLFAIMTGASATIIRASFMALIVIFAKLSGRESESLKALFVAAFVMLIINPMLLVYDPSFQLSFLATLGLIIFSPWVENFLEEKMYFKKNYFGLRTLVSATIATSIFVTPLLLYMMGEISIISPIVNMLILIFVPITMLFGFLAIIFSFFFFEFGLLIAFLSYIFLHYDITITNYFSNFSFATLGVSSFSLTSVLFVYLMYIFIFLWAKKVF